MRGGAKQIFPRQRNRRVAVFICVLTLLGLVAAQAHAKQSTANCPSKTLRTMSRVYMAYGDYAKAQVLAEQALAAAKTADNSDSENSACMIDLAWLYKNQGRLADAEKMCVTGLEIQESLYYKDHPYIAYTLRILGSIYRQQGNYHKAQAALDRAMAIMSKCHLPDDPVLAPFKVDFAKLLAAQGKFADAERYYLAAMKTISDTYGPDHLYTAAVSADIAQLYTQQGRLDEAESLINQAIAIQEKVYGPDNHLLAAAWMTKARICQARKDYTQARQLCERAISVLENVFDRNHPIVLSAQQTMAQLQQRPGWSNYGDWLLKQTGLLRLFQQYQLMLFSGRASAKDLPSHHNAGV